MKKSKNVTSSNKELLLRKMVQYSCLFSSLFFVLTVSMGHVAFATTVRQVKDIRPGSPGSYPQYFGYYDNKSFFCANDDTNGDELWITDGSTKGTSLFKDIYPGSSGSGPGHLIVFNNKLFFSAQDNDTNGEELWVSDGTVAGTAIVKDLSGSWQSTGPRYFTVSNNLLYFSGQSSSVGTELWKSDGTAANTGLLKDINSSGDGLGFSLSAADVNGTLFFVADDGTNGSEIWKTDGTEINTVMVDEVNVGSGSSQPNSLVKFANALYFTASNSGTRNVYYYDDSSNTSILLRDIPPGMGSSYPAYLTVSGGKLFFIANKNSDTFAMGGHELWVSDGTEVGTTKIKDIHPDANTSSDPGSFTDVNGILFFTADDGTNGRELWKTDGTAVNTVLVKDIYPGDSSNPSQLTVHDGILYFFATTVAEGTELWQSDGTPEGTVLVADVNPGSGSIDGDLYSSGPNLFMSIDDGNTGYELWSLTDSAPVVIKVNSTTETDDHEIVENEGVSVNVTELFVTFDQAVVNAANPANYLLFSRGANNTFDTLTCAAGIGGDDVSIVIDGAVYDLNSRTTTLSINGTISLPPDTYRLLVCGSTSIENPFSDKLDGNEDGTGGDDFSRNFIVVEDTDNDGILNHLDNCPTESNADQADGDGDNVGDVCDNCDALSNFDQSNQDGDNYGDVCDNCSLVNNNDQADDDGDSMGDACDPDDDNDDLPDTWEILYGFNPFDSSDRDLDPDSDQFTNYQEFLNGTDPSVPNYQITFPWNLFLPAILEGKK